MTAPPLQLSLLGYAIRLAATGDIYYAGTALITGITRRAAINGMVEVEFSFQGTGVLTTSTAA